MKNNVLYSALIFVLVLLIIAIVLISRANPVFFAASLFVLALGFIAWDKENNPEK